MNIQGIINKKIPTTEESIFVIESYIFEKKGRKVKVRSPEILLSDPFFGRHNFQNEIAKIMNAYNYAKSYYTP